ncbi:plastocyanin/azurin family copper-binding protein [Portibacter lacus]|uniref:Large multi-functional protein n=1 Tax=Portibacter lacus TaxID=1099794 RepID=A0AA37SKA8_9BACT|nr:plastocyanin/azurin family copper-binding protein [Portibacter lacus]GLR16118.1 large multi-functional protein [Portibacter lacus]
MKRTIHIIIYLFAIQLSAQVTNAVKEDVYYSIQDIFIPENIELEVGGMVFNDKGSLGITTRRGELWEITNPSSKQPVYNRFASGLHEPLGLNWKDGSYYLSQRGELTKLTDINKDGKADKYESIYSWPLEGNYHEYSYGPKFLPNGDMLVSLNLGWIGKGASLSKWRGWIVQISPEGELTPIATGMRSPAGFGFNSQGDLFYTENQGDWVGSGRMTHVEKGDFVGNPEGLKWSGEEGSPVSLKFEDFQDLEETTLYDYSKKVEGIKPPSVWFPHTLMGISTSDLVVIPEGFGPFENQLLVGDQGHSKVMRVFQEKVNGVYQGICFPFREGFESGILRMVFDDDQSLYVGMTSRGWSSTGKKKFGLERLVWNKNLPFEMKTVKAKSFGFEIEFTDLVDKASATDIESYSITDFNYKYHLTYGSPIINQEVKNISKVELDDDQKTVRIYIDGMRNGYIYEIDAKSVNDRSGSPLLHNKGYYTLNEIPAGENGVVDHSAHNMPEVETKDIISPKRPTDMPKSWTEGPDQIITMGTKPGLKFDISEVTVKAGSKIKLVFNNNDDMLHNMIIVNPEKADEVAQLAVELGLSGLEKGFIPQSDEIIAHTNLMQPHTSDAIYFSAPSKPGTYQYVCTFPGHAAIMRGIMIVE